MTGLSAPDARLHTSREGQPWQGCSVRLIFVARKRRSVPFRRSTGAGTRALRYAIRGKTQPGYTREKDRAPGDMMRVSR